MAKCVFARGTLEGLFNQVKSVFPHKSVNPDHKYFRLNVHDGNAIACATNGEQIVLARASETVDCDKLSTTIFPGTFDAILMATKENDIAIEDCEGGPHITIGGSEFCLFAPQTSFDFSIKPLTYSHRFTVDSLTLRGALSQTEFCTENSNTNVGYATDAVMLTMQKGQSSAVATDQRRLSLARCGKIDSNDSANLLLSKSAVKTLLSLIPKTLSYSIKIETNLNRATFAGAEWTLETLLRSGRYPRYEDVIPKTHKVSVHVPVGEILKCVRQASLVASAESVGVYIEVSEGECRVRRTDKSRGSCETSIPVSYTGQSTRVLVNGAYVVECLKHLDPASTVEMRIIDEESPIVFIGDNEYLHMIMTLTEED